MFSTSNIEICLFKNFTEHNQTQPMTIIDHIQELSISFSTFDLVYVNREANIAAHCCAKEALSGRCSVLWESHHADILLHVCCKKIVTR